MLVLRVWISSWISLDSIGFELLSCLHVGIPPVGFS